MYRAYLLMVIDKVYKGHDHPALFKSERQRSVEINYMYLYRIMTNITFSIMFLKNVLFQACCFLATVVHLINFFLRQANITSNLILHSSLALPFFS